MAITSPANENELEELLSEPYPETVDLMRRLEGDIILLGVAGKVGPSLARMAVKACQQAGVSKRIIGVARFSDSAQKVLLEEAGVETVVCDLSDAEQVSTLPKVKNVIYLAGRKFGDVGSEPLTWIMNVIVPSNVASVYCNSRIVAFSTGCVYALENAGGKGSSEQDRPVPVGEYANSCLGRERIFEHYSNTCGTEVLQYRLNYAIDLRYGVLSDIALPIWEGKAVSRSVPEFNIIWQGDANNRALLCLEHATSPPIVLNITGPETISTDEVARKFGEIFNKPVNFTGEAGSKMYLSDASRSMELFGQPRVGVDDMIRMTAEWIMHGGRNLNKPTHFTVTDGQFLDEPTATKGSH